MARPGTVRPRRTPAYGAGRAGVARPGAEASWRKSWFGGDDAAAEEPAAAPAPAARETAQGRPGLASS